MNQGMDYTSIPCKISSGKINNSVLTLVDIIDLWVEPGYLKLYGWQTASQVDFSHERPLGLIRVFCYLVSERSGVVFSYPRLVSIPRGMNKLKTFGVRP
jgi:hypothetical protein